MSDVLNNDHKPIPSPQPLGIFPLPAGYLLIGPGEAEDVIRTQLLKGLIPEKFPESLRYYSLALEGDLEAAIRALPADATLLDRVNRLVLMPSQGLLDELLRLTSDLTDWALQTHVEMIGFVVGLMGTPPDPAKASGEFAAMAHSARATLALERRAYGEAIDELEAAAQAAHPISKAMAGQLLGQMAHAQLEEGGTQRAAVTFQAALDALESSELFISRAELHVAAGSMFQEMSESAPRLLQKAIDHYQHATALVNAKTAPETFAIANANLGLAYISMPMVEASDQLRMGVAIQSMREALSVFTPENHPGRWSSTQLNLANALVYLPSKHQAENIAEAIGLYEGVLQHRDRETDPQGRARVLANQGNALAHLGVFDDAKSKLHEARFIFEEFEETAAVQSVRSILDGIAKQESLLRTGSAP